MRVKMYELKCGSFLLISSSEACGLVHRGPAPEPIDPERYALEMRALADTLDQAVQRINENDDELARRLGETVAQ